MLSTGLPRVFVFLYDFFNVLCLDVSPSKKPILMSQSSLTCGDGSSQTVAINWLVWSHYAGSMFRETVWQGNAHVIYFDDSVFMVATTDFEVSAYL